MEKRIKVIITFTLAVILIAVLYQFSDWFSKTTGYLIGEDTDIDFAKCLSLKEVKFYGSETCNDCRKQQKIFGKEAFSYINYIDCSKSSVKCYELERIPAWEVKGIFYYGTKTRDELKILSSCL